jgi:phage shock protein A
VRESEDPEKLIDAALVELQQDLVQLRQAVAQAVAIHKRTERQWMQAQASADEWYQRAQLAINSGNEALARDALVHRQPYQQSAEDMERRLRDRATTVTHLRETMRHVEHKLLEIRSQRDFYLARARSAEATQRLHQLTDRLGHSTDPLLTRLADKVTHLEAQASLSDPNRDPIAAQFSRLEQEQRLEADLDRLRSNPTARSLEPG